MQVNDEKRQATIAMMNSQYGIGVTEKKPFEQMCKDLDLEYCRINCDGPLGGYTLIFRTRDGRQTIKRQVNRYELYDLKANIDDVLEIEIRERFAQMKKDGGYDRNR